MRTSLMNKMPQVLRTMVALALIFLIGTACANQANNTSDHDANHVHQQAETSNNATSAEMQTETATMQDGSATTVPTEPEPAAEPATEASQVVQVEIKDFAYQTEKLEISVGTIVEFINHDAVKHTATGDNGEFDTGLLGKDEAKQITFDKAGTFAYHCAPHPGMKGTILVQ